MTRGFLTTAIVSLSLVSSAWSAEPGQVLTSRDAFGDWTTDAPGVRRKISVDDLAKPFETRSSNFVVDCMAMRASSTSLLLAPNRPAAPETTPLVA